MGGSGSSQGGRNQGEGGNWCVVRSRKRKATQPEDGRRDMSRVSTRHRGAGSERYYHHQAQGRLQGESHNRSRSRQVDDRKCIDGHRRMRCMNGEHGYEYMGRRFMH